MPYYTQKKKPTARTTWVTSSNTSTAPRSRYTSSRTSATTKSSGYRRRQAPRTTAQFKPSGSTPFMTRIRQAEATSRMRSTNGAQQQAPTEDTRSTQLTSTLSSPPPNAQLVSPQSSAQPLFSTQHPHIPLQGQMLNQAPRPHLQQPAS